MRIAFFHTLYLGVVSAGYVVLIKPLFVHAIYLCKDSSGAYALYTTAVGYRADIFVDRKWKFYISLFS